jgi:hypothetical protein
VPSDFVDSVLGDTDLGGPHPMSSAAPDLPTTSIQTQFAKQAGQRQRELAELGNSSDQGPPQTTDETPAASLKPDEGTASTDNSGASTTDLAATAGDAMKSLASPAPAAAAPAAPPKPPPAPDWAHAVEGAMRAQSDAFMNPFTPVDNDPRKDPEIAYHSAQAVGRAWNALTDPNAISQSVANIYNDDSARGKINQEVLASMFGVAGLTAGPNNATVHWLAQNALPMALTAGADFSYPTFALSMLGNVPDNPNKLPGSIWNASPPGVIASAVSDPGQLRTPEGATRLLWKYITASLNALALMPVARNAVKPFLSARALADVDKGLVAATFEKPTTNQLPTAEEMIPQATEIPNVASSSIAAPAAGAERAIPAARNVETGEIKVDMRAAAAQERAMLAKVGLENWGQFPERAAQLTDEQVAAAKANWSKYMPYDLVRQYPEDRVATPPMDHIDQVAPENRGAYKAMVDAATVAMTHIKAGPYAQEANATDSLIHSLMPLHRTTDWVMKQVFLPALGRLGATAKLDGVAIQRALRDPAAYDELPPEAKGVADTWDLLTRVIRDERGKINFPVGAVPAFDPRVPMSVPDQLGKLNKQVAKALQAREQSGKVALYPGNRSHRAEALTVDPNNPEQVVLAEKHPDVWSINSSQAERQKDAALALIDKGVPAEEAAARAAQQFPLYHTDFFRAAGTSLSNAIHSLHSYQAADVLSNARHAETGAKLAYKVGEEGAPADYKRIESSTGAYRNMLWHPSFADKINDISSDPLEGPGVVKALGRAVDKLNNIGRTLVMLSPTIHGENLLGRAVDLFFTHPTATIDAIKGRVADQPDMVTNLMRQLQAYRAGVVPHLPHSMNVENLYSQMGHQTGDVHQFDVPGLRDASVANVGQTNGLATTGRAIGGGYQYLQNRLWQGAANFAVNAFHITRAELDGRFPDSEFGIKHTVSLEAKDAYAASRANQWQGRLAPEEWNKATYTASRLLFFAPNWQRTFYELMAPSYNARALAANPELRRVMFANELHTVRGMMLAQLLTGNATNLMLSGHPQWENDRGNTHKIEVTNPYILRAMQAVGQLQDFDPATGRRASDGAVVTMENPWARQQLQAERPTGFDDVRWKDGQLSNASSDTPGEGALADLAGQTAPAWGQIASALNVDLYRSIHDGQIRALNPNEDPGPHLDNLMPTMLNILNAAGLGQAGAQQEVAPNQQSQRQQAAAGRQLPGPLQSQNLPPWLTGTVAPLGVREAIASGGDTITSWLFHMLTGISTPYVKPPRTGGEKLSDSQVLQRNGMEDSYDGAMTDASNKMLSGQMTPQQWLTTYQNAHTPYVNGMRSLYNGAPEYTQGQLGLVNDYLNLANDPKVHDPTTGTIDYAKLNGAQDQFKSKLTPQQITDLDTGLSKNDQRYPALALYRAVQKAHDDVAAQWAVDMGIPPLQLRDTVARYGRMSGPEQQQFIAQHPEIRQYQQRQRDWEMNYWPGRLYGLYYMTPTVQRWLMSAYGSTSPAAQEEAANEIATRAHAKPAA